MAGGTGGADIRLNYAQIRSSARKLNSEKEDMIQKLNSMKRMVDNLVQTDFVTQKAGPKFEKDYQDWNRGASKMLEGLKGMSDFLNKAVVEQFEGVDARAGGRG